MIETINTSSKYIIKQILKDNWNDFCLKHKNHIQDTVVDNVAKVMDCGNKEAMGYSVFHYPCCNQKKIVPHTCKSKFYNFCGKTKNDEWIVKSQERLLVGHSTSHKNLSSLRQKAVKTVRQLHNLA